MAHIYTDILDGNMDCTPINIDSPEGEAEARRWVRDNGGEWAAVYVGEPGSPDERKSGALLFGEPHLEAERNVAIATQAIARSIAHNEIVTIDGDDDLMVELAILSTDSVDAGDVTEFWGYNERDRYWRVHVAAEKE